MIYRVRENSDQTRLLLQTPFMCKRKKNTKKKLDEKMIELVPV